VLQQTILKFDLPFQHTQYQEANKNGECDFGLDWNSSESVQTVGFSDDSAVSSGNIVNGVSISCSE
jgi:hypothetical protein